MELLCKLRHVSLTSVNLFHVHLARTLAVIDIMLADLRQGIPVIRKGNRIPARKRTKAIPVCTDIGAALFNQLNVLGIIHLRSNHHEPCAPFLIVRLPGLELFQGLLQFVKEKLLRADIGCQRQHSKLVARDPRLFLLTKFSNGTDQLANPVMYLNGLSDRLVRYVDAIDLGERFQNMVFALQYKKLYAIIVRLKGNLHMLIKKPLIPLHGMQKLHIFGAAIHHGTAVRRNQAVSEIVATLYGAL